MRVESLRYFLEVVQRGSFTRAAESLFLTQQGLSRAIGSLESELGTQLFRRDGKRLALTEAGERVLPFARAIVEQEEALRRSLAIAPAAPTLREVSEIAISEFASNGIFHFLSDKMEQWGLSEAIIEEQSADALVKRLASGDSGTPALVIVRSGPRASLPEGTEFEPFFSMDCVVSGTRDFISPRRKVISVEELAGMPLAYYNDPTINELVSELFGGDVPANVVMHSSNWDAVRRTATSGRAVMISDSFTEYLQPANDTMTTLKIRGTARYLFGCATSRANPPTGAQASYIDTLGDMLRAECRGYLERYGTD